MTGDSEKLTVIAATAFQYLLDTQTVRADLHAILQRVPRNTDVYIPMRGQELVESVDSFETVLSRHYNERCVRLGSRLAK